MRFQDDEYHNSPIISESKLEWKQLPIIPYTSIMQIEEQIIVNEDNLLMAITGLTDKEDTIFSIKENQKRLNVDGDFNLRFVQQYQIGYSVKKVERSVYNFLMFLGDVGGLYGLLFSVLATLSAIFSF